MTPRLDARIGKTARKHVGTLRGLDHLQLDWKWVVRSFSTA